MTPLKFNHVRRQFSRRRAYRVCVADTDLGLYTKVFRAYSPRHALALASQDSEQNRAWRADWQRIGERAASFGTTVEEVRA